MTIDPQELPVPKLHGYLLGAIGPRPIAFASTVDREGRVNLSPYSFFNVFSTQPPILIFSPARRGKDNTTKHTYENIKEHPEVVINVVSYDMVEQMSLSSTEYEKGVDEFVKAGFTKGKSTKVQPPRVAESPVSFECRVNEVRELGNKGGAGNLIICEVLLMHVKEEILNDQGQIDPQKIDQVARMGANWYTRASEGLFEVEKPLATKGIGIDRMPKSIRDSQILTGNHLGRLGNVEALPSDAEVESFSHEPEIQAILSDLEADPDQLTEELHKQAIMCLERGDVMKAWKVLLQSS